MSVFFAKLKLYRERLLHIIVGFIVVPLVAIFSHAFFGISDKHKWEYQEIYSSVFDIATVYSALLFGFVSYFRTMKNPFLAALPERLYWGAINYAEDGFKLGMALMFVTVPFMVLKVRPIEPMDIHSIALGIWSGLVIASFLAFIRASKIFWKLMRATNVR